jgi:hypothetical protein
MVCSVHLSKASISQANLKKRVGEALDLYLEASRGQDGAPTKCEPSRRAWTLYYPSDFHMDVLPALPNPAAPPTGIILTDKELRDWQHSDPIEYAKWFRRCMQLEFETKRRAMASEMRKSVEEIPEFLVRTTLQRVVQVLKRHRDIYFLGDLGDRPPSILITTLVARAYRGENDLLSAVVATAQAMPTHIGTDEQGRDCVMSPVAEENFADKWNDYPERKQKFRMWLDQVERDLDEAQGQRGLPNVVSRLSASFGDEPMAKAARSLGIETRELRESGKLAVAGAAATLTTRGGTTIRPHGFYGN